MAKGFIHTVYKNDQWINEVEEGESIGGVHATKEEAVAAGRARAQQDQTEHVIHNQDGTFGERNRSGNDPASRPGSADAPAGAASRHEVQVCAMSPPQTPPPTA